MSGMLCKHLLGHCELGLQTEVIPLHTTRWSRRACLPERYTPEINLQITMQAATRELVGDAPDVLRHLAMRNQNRVASIHHDKIAHA